MTVPAATEATAGAELLTAVATDVAAAAASAAVPKSGRELATMSTTYRVKGRRGSG